MKKPPFTLKIPLLQTPFDRISPANRSFGQPHQSVRRFCGRQISLSSDTCTGEHSKTPSSQSAILAHHCSSLEPFSFLRPNRPLYFPVQRDNLNKNTEPARGKND